MKLKYISSSKAPAAIGPYSQAVSAGGFLFCSGQIPINPSTGETISEIKEATKQVIENIKGVLSAENLDLSNIVKTTIFLTDMKNFADVNEVYSTYFADHRPARACVEVSGLPKGVSIEMEAIAFKG